MSVRILTGDCRDVLPTLAANSFDCIVTDPPYGETSLAWDRTVRGCGEFSRQFAECIRSALLASYAVPAKVEAA